MDRPPQDALNTSARCAIPSPSSNDTMSAAGQSASSSTPSNSTVDNTTCGTSHQELRPPYHAPSQVHHHLNYAQGPSQTQDTRRESTDASYGERHEDAYGNVNITAPPINSSKKPEAQLVESCPEQPTPSARLHGPMSIASLLTHPNGVSIFPELSASEQYELSREALEEAEEAIVADSAESVHGGVSDSASDAGYDSDGVSSASTSVMSSVRDYMYENGRRYHRFREGSYNFPNDDVEQEREDMKHAMVKLLCSQKLHFAPIGDNPQEILDIGTGTGIWTIEMGDRFSSAHILGIDLSPIQPDWLPPNVRFMVDDVESPWLHPRNHFDYIHSRHTVMAIRDWDKLLRTALDHLKYGGWIELQEIHHTPRSALAGGTGEMPPDHPVARFWKHVTDGLAALGVDLDAVADAKLSDAMRRAGYANVTERVLHVPIGTWPKNKVLKTVGLYWRTILLDGLQAIALGPLTRGLGWNREQVEMLLIEVRQAYFDNTPLMYMPFHIIYAQKA
ncbi:Secondary metabolism regulator LAE1 [Trichoderma ghanense]|uniref:Secondary metabolism regulator LAE1 n=1 Tax=Trichoderma ghanense TaxID=65468 RepID=A0ABY2GYY9_9HYPO